MLATSIAGIDLTAWNTWVVVSVGVVTAGLTLLGSRLFLSRRKTSSSEELPPAEPDPRVDPFVQGSASEKRASLRREGNPVEVFITDVEEQIEPVRGWVIDRSLGGIRLLLHEPVELSLTLNVRPRQAPPGTPWTQVVVKSCERKKNGYQAGCMFLRPPPWSIMLLFG
jgi:hypothetical protein